MTSSCVNHTHDFPGASVFHNLCIWTLELLTFFIPLIIECISQTEAEEHTSIHAL